MLEREKKLQSRQNKTNLMNKSNELMIEVEINSSVKFTILC